MLKDNNNYIKSIFKNNILRDVEIIIAKITTSTLPVEEKKELKKKIIERLRS